LAYRSANPTHTTRDQRNTTKRLHMLSSFLYFALQDGDCSALTGRAEVLRGDGLVSIGAMHEMKQNYWTLLSSPRSVCIG